MKFMMRFGRKEKLNPCFIGPLEILQRVPVEYKVALPPSFLKVNIVPYLNLEEVCFLPFSCGGIGAYSYFSGLDL